MSVLPNIIYVGTPQMQKKCVPNHVVMNDPVILGTTSYIDAVIASSDSTQYNVIVGGYMKSDTPLPPRYLDEQYPGAFSKFDVIGYIHHLKGKFVPLEGFHSEFTSKVAIVPIKVDKVNVLDYLKKSGIIMRTYEEVEKARSDITNIINLTGNILCHISSIDEPYYERQLVKDICDDRGFDLVHVGPIRADRHFENPTVLYGDANNGWIKYESVCDKIFITENPLSLAEQHDKLPKKRTSTFEFIKYLVTRKETFHPYFWQTYPNVMSRLDDMITQQYNIRKKYPNIEIIHITGASGAGKTTLQTKLNSMGIITHDSDDLFVGMESKDDVNKFIYNRIEQWIDAVISQNHAKMIIVGMPLSLVTLATKHYYLDVDDITVYEQFTSRSVTSICDNKNVILSALNEHKITNDNEFYKFMGENQVRCCFIAPDSHIRNDIHQYRDRMIECGYTFIKVDELIRVCSK